MLRTEAIDAHLARALESGARQLVILGAGLDARAWRLEGAGFRAEERSIWIWEGVAMYLPLSAVYDTLHQLTSLAARGSLLAMTYRVPGQLPFGAMGRAAIPALFAATGEPLKSTLEPSELAAALSHHWNITYDEDPRGWRALTGSAGIPARAFLSERLAVMKRRP